MEKLGITNHAIIRRYERFHNENEDFDRAKLIQEIEDEFLKSKFIKQINEDSGIYQSEDTTFVVYRDETEDSIVTLYRKGGNKDKSDDEIRVNNKITDKKEIRLINRLLEEDELVIIKHMGSKKLVILNDMLVLVRIEFINNKNMINVIQKWSEQELKDKNILEQVKSLFFINCTEPEWIKFLQKINLYDYVFHVEKVKNIRQSYDEEVQIYKEVLNGERKQFPSGFWRDDIGGNEHPASKACVKYLIEDYLEWSVIDIYNKFTYDLFSKYKLAGMIRSVFQSNRYYPLLYTYPNIKIWKLKKCGSIYWYWRAENDGLNHIKEAMEWFKDTLLHDEGIDITKINPLSVNWYEKFMKYKLHEIISSGFEYNYKEFFKVCFGIEYSDEDIYRYYNIVHEHGGKSQFIKAHI